MLLTRFEPIREMRELRKGFDYINSVMNSLEEQDVEAKTQKQTDKSKSNFIQKEIYKGSFSRSITLPQDAKGDDFKSKFENGVLKITIPKKS